MARDQKIKRFRFTFAEVVEAMLDGVIEDCAETRITIDAGMVAIDLIEPASLKAPAAPAHAEKIERAMMTLEEATKIFRMIGDNEFAEIMEAEIERRKKEQKASESVPAVSESDETERENERAAVAHAGGVAASFKAEVDAAADAETAASEAASEDENDEHDPFWDSDAGDDDQPKTPEEQVPEDNPHRWAQIAGILCNEGAFQKFLFATNKDEAAVKLREKCGVKSRSEIDGNPAAIAKLKDLRATYSVWLDGG
jgi:hypothetical protein